MKKILLLVVTVVVCGVAFAKKQKNKTKQNDNAIISVALRHTGCLGRCRDYTIEVNKNGMATYIAARFNADTGTFTKRIGKTKARDIIDQFETYRVDTCQDFYPSRIPDLPGMLYKINYSGRSKTINDAKYGPSYLLKMSVVIDSLIGPKADDTWRRMTSKEEK